MTHPRRHRGPASAAGRSGPGTRRTGSRRPPVARSAPPAPPTPTPRDIATDGPPPPTAPTEPSHPTGVGLTVGAVVRAGAVVGVDDSELVHGLLPDLVAARPALIGTASLAAVLTLTGTAAARAGTLTVRLFGGEQRAGASTGPITLHAVTATRCDVAFVGGRVVGDDVWVPTDAAPGRTALLLGAGRAYLVPATAGERILLNGLPPSDDPGWTRIAAVDDFDGVVGAPPPVDPLVRPAAA